MFPTDCLSLTRAVCLSPLSAILHLFLPFSPHLASPCLFWFSDARSLGNRLLRWCWWSLPRWRATDRTRSSSCWLSGLGCWRPWRRAWPTPLRCYGKDEGGIGCPAFWIAVIGDHNKKIKQEKTTKYLYRNSWILLHLCSNKRVCPRSIPNHCWGLNRAHACTEQTRLVGRKNDAATACVCCSTGPGNGNIVAVWNRPVR